MGPVDFSSPDSFLEALGWWYLYSDPPILVRALPQALEFYQAMHTVHSGEGVRRQETVLLCREDDGSISISVYRKVMDTNQYLSFISHHPMAHKAAVVRSLMTRASALLTSGVEYVEEDKKISEVLQPLGFVHKYSCPSRMKQRDDQGPRTNVTLPYISGL